MNLLSFCDVAGDLGKANQAARLVADRIEDDKGPKPRAVFFGRANLPTQSGPYRSAVAKANLGRSFSRSSGCVKDRKRLPEDLFAAEYPLRRSAPVFQLLTVPSLSSMKIA